MKVEKIFIILLLVCINFILCATEQESDYIKIDDIEHKLFTNPVYELLQFEDFHNKYITVISGIKDFSVSSACWRGYIAYFEIKNDLLYLNDIIVHTVSLENIGRPEDRDISIYSKLFDSQKSFFCNFYSGILIIPAGECIKEIYSGYDSMYENYLIIKIRNGQVIQKKEFKYNEFQDRKSEAFKRYKLSEKYKTDFSEAKEIFTVIISAEELDKILYESDKLYLYEYFIF
ncbi:MAG: hypothetical protein ACTTKC_03590 [Treponema sp.]|uniref:hypothetical protein n=1 Tax=Treponema sp. TaxID=166 RepID=UPI003FA25033